MVSRHRKSNRCTETQTELIELGHSIDIAKSSSSTSNEIHCQSISVHRSPIISTHDGYGDLINFWNCAIPLSKLINPAPGQPVNFHIQQEPNDSHSIPPLLLFIQLIIHLTNHNRREIAEISQTMRLLLLQRKHPRRSEQTINMNNCYPITGQRPLLLQLHSAVHATKVNQDELQVD